MALECGALGYNYELYGAIQDPYEGYRFGEKGFLYQVHNRGTELEPKMMIQRGNKEDFRKQTRPKKIDCNIYRHIKDNEMLFLIAMPGIAKQFDIVINEMFISFYEEKPIISPRTSH